MNNVVFRISSALILLMVLVTVTTHLQPAHADLYEGSPCELHNGSVGFCKISRNCDWLIQNLRQKKITFGDIRRCTFSGPEDIICCGDEQPDGQKPGKPDPNDDRYIFDSPNSIPTVTQKNPSTLSSTRFSGERVADACKQYTAIALPYIPTYIINGRPAGLSEFPHMAGLGYINSDSDEYSFDCGGSLIADQWIVTAAHCIKDRRKPKIVRLGKVFLHSNDDDVDAIDRTITRIVRHPNYSGLTKKNDIALIQFDGSVEFTDNVRPACIRTALDDIPPSQELFIAGWGTIEAERTNRSEVLLKANVNSVPLESCNATLVQYNKANNPSLRSISAGQMCASDPFSDACKGDSGGPIFSWEQQTGVSTIAGIVSFGISCGTALPSIYTRISYYVDWIESVVWP